MLSGSRRLAVRPLAVLLLAVALLVFGTNLQGVVLPIVGHGRGSGIVTIGLYSASWSAGFVFACLCVGQVLGRLGSRRGFVTLALLSTCMSTLLLLFPGDRTWIYLRLVIGFCYGGMSAIVEGWLMGQAGASRAFASYMLVNLLASLAGTLSLDVTGVVGPTPFLLTSAAIVLSAGTVALGRIPSPPIPERFYPHIGLLVRKSPLASLGCVVAGLITGAIAGLAPLFGIMSALSVDADTIMLAANTVGGAIATLMLALLSERVGRHRLLIAQSMLGLIICAPFVMLSHLPRATLIALMGAFGFVQYPLYGLCVGIANAATPDRLPARIAGELLLLFGLGTIAGPLIGSELLKSGIPALFAFIGGTLLVLLITGLWAQLGPRLKPPITG